ncbi:MAG: hypothetical protein INH37_23005 [Myxococcaceae bacterium]|nr:hypothetical protein [Myxococcaceae bacterium]
MLLKDRKLLITGVLTPQSIAYGVAELAIKEGAEVILTPFGQPMSLTQRTARKLAATPASSRAPPSRTARRFAPASSSVSRSTSETSGARCPTRTRCATRPSGTRR